MRPGRKRWRPLRKAKAESWGGGLRRRSAARGAFGTLARLSPRLEGALDVSLRNGNGGAMPVLRVPEMDRLKHAISGAIRPK